MDDFRWFWLNFFDFGWFSLIFADFDRIQAKEISFNQPLNSIWCPINRNFYQFFCIMFLFLMISYQNHVYIECSMNLIFLVIEISWKLKKIEENWRNLFSSEISFEKSNFFDFVQFSLILVDFLWFWLIFFDFGWISLILFNFQCNKIDCKHL